MNFSIFFKILWNLLHVVTKDLRHWYFIDILIWTCVFTYWFVFWFWYENAQLINQIFLRCNTKNVCTSSCWLIYRLSSTFVIETFSVGVCINFKVSCFTLKRMMTLTKLKYVITSVFRTESIICRWSLLNQIWINSDRKQCIYYCHNLASRAALSFSKI